MKTRRYILIALALLALGLLLATPSLSRSLHTYHERQCLKKGWSRLTLSVEGQARKVLWKAPAGPWKGAIVILHGGGGACSDFGSTVEIGQPMVEFSSLALSRGFAVVCPDSGDSLARDAQGRGYGKRWDCLPVDHRDNVDLPFLREVLGQTVPALRPSGSGKGVFLAGISNGGYMAILTATHFPELVTAFAPVSCGDPYGTYLDLGTAPVYERERAPGIFRDRASRRNIADDGAAARDAHEMPWPTHQLPSLPPFRQFHSEGDRIVDLSNMRKAQRHLARAGYPDAGALVLPDIDRRETLREHLWRVEYNEPMLDFFETTTGDPDPPHSGASLSFPNFA